jgi:hypothetical protein
MAPATPIWRLVLPIIALGLAMAFLWVPLAATATRNLPAHLTGASSGVYNATRLLGAVTGSAGMAALTASRIAHVLPPKSSHAHPSAAAQLPDSLRAPLSAAMSESMLLPAVVAVFGIVAALFMSPSTPSRSTDSGS